MMYAGSRKQNSADAMQNAEKGAGEIKLFFPEL